MVKQLVKIFLTAGIIMIFFYFAPNAFALGGNTCTGSNITVKLGFWHAEFGPYGKTEEEIRSRIDSWKNQLNTVWNSGLTATSCAIPVNFTFTMKYFNTCHDETTCCQLAFGEGYHCIEITDMNPPQCNNHNACQYLGAGVTAKGWWSATDPQSWHDVTFNCSCTGRLFTIPNFVQTIAAHETGHVLGLNDEYKELGVDQDSQNNLMGISLGKPTLDQINKIITDNCLVGLDINNIGPDTFCDPSNIPWVQPSPVTICNTNNQYMLTCADCNGNTSTCRCSSANISTPPPPSSGPSQPIVGMAPNIPSAPAQAFTIIPGCWKLGTCSVCDLIGVAVKAGVIILEFIGALALLFFIFGGFVWLTSGGEKEKINKGKNILKNAVIGMFIVLFAYGGVNMIYFIFTGNTTWQEKIICGATPVTPATPAPTPAPTGTCTAEVCNRLRKLQMGGTLDKTASNATCKPSSAACMVTTGWIYDYAQDESRTTLCPGGTCCCLQ